MHSCIQNYRYCSPFISDNFTLIVPWLPPTEFGPIYVNYLHYNITSEPGVFAGTWPFLPEAIFPDTVVATGPEIEGVNKSTQYAWAIEMQCVEKYNAAIFVSINFLSRVNVGILADQYFQNMYAKAVSLGIDKYWVDTKTGLRRVDHTGCYYE